MGLNYSGSGVARDVSARDKALEFYRRTKEVLSWYDEVGDSVGQEKISVATNFHSQAKSECYALGITDAELLAH